MSNYLTASKYITKEEAEERKLRGALRSAVRKAEEDRYRAYFDEQRERVRQDCGNEVVFEQCTWWCKTHAQIWRDHVKLQDRREGDPPHEDKWRGYASMMFVRDTLMNGLFADARESHLYPPYESYENQVGGQMPELFVVGEHTSKRIRMPVMQFLWRDMLVSTRYNFYDWKVSVRLPECLDVEKDLLNIVEVDNSLLNPVYFEGFPDAYIFPPLSANDYALTAQFSVMFGSQYQMWTFFWLLKRWYDGRFGAIKPIVWHDG